MTLPVFKATEPDGLRALHKPCSACGEYATADEATGLCRPCWRVVSLGPAPRPPCDDCHTPGDTPHMPGCPSRHGAGELLAMLREIDDTADRCVPCGSTDNSHAADCRLAALLGRFRP